MPSEVSETELAQQVARGAFVTGISLRPGYRTAGHAETQRVISQLSKRVSQRAVDKIDDRQARQVARTEVYNAVRPILETMASQHAHLSLRAKHLTFMLFASAAIGGLVGWTLA